MFAWLEVELRSIRTPRFHEVGGPADPRLEKAVMESGLPVPSSYMEFVLEFGNAKLYRTSRTGYRIHVFAGPREAALADGTQICYIGFHDGASVYVKSRSGVRAYPIFELQDGFEKKIANDFEQWLVESCNLARKHYSKKEWMKILRGPDPFSDKEREIVETRQQLVWHVLGIDPAGNHIFEVENNGKRALRFLTVGVRSNDGRLNGAVRLDIGNIGPKQSGRVHADCYKGLVPPSTIEAFALPDPQPEDRAFYFEFQERE